MEVQIVRNCPICGEVDVESLTEHLQAHTKQSLINALLGQSQKIRRTGHGQTSSSSSAIVSSTPAPAPTPPEQCESAGANSGQPLGELIKPTSSRAPVSVGGGVGGESKRSYKHKSGGPSSGHGHVYGRKSHSGNSSSVTHIELDNRPSSSTTTVIHKHLNPRSVAQLVIAEIDSNSFRNQLLNIPKTKPRFILVDHSTPSKPGPSRRRVSNEVGQSDTASITTVASSKPSEIPDIPPSTSIIQYIIDESGQITDAPQEEPDSWILADGRSIPVYSSLTQVPSASDTTTSCTMIPGISSKSKSRGVEKERNITATSCISTERTSPPNQMHLDLMTDEEIPPRGEISEYEESNASSIMSEDSNLKSTSSGVFIDRRSPATVIHDQNFLHNRKKKSPPKPQQQYTCQECPQVQVFRELFELAEHKFEVHQSKSVNNTTSVTIAVKSYPKERLMPDAHILPEKIRRQSQQDDSVGSQDTLEETKALLLGSSSTPAPKKEYFCVYCSFTALRKATVTKHMQENHADQPQTPSLFECNHCGKIFHARTNLRKHILIHKERKYSCPTCQKGFTSNFKVVEHMRIHTKIYPFKCTVCDKMYRTLSLRNHHMKMTHLPEGERPVKRKLEFYCSTCHRVLHSKRSYQNHMQLHQEKPMKCSFCSELFTRNSVLVRHIRIAHDANYESKESKDCPVCHKKLHPNSMIKHMRIHSNEKPYSCNVCGKLFRTYANLTSHQWSHTNLEKPHKCRLCSKSYLFKKNLENHMMVHKKRTMHFTCNECGVKFSHKVNMKRHLEEHFKEKSHVCKICNKAFQRHYYLVEHERIHSGLKPYQCTICGKASTTKSNHRAHLKIHDARETGNQEG